MSRRGGHEQDDDSPPWLAPAEPDLRKGRSTVVPGSRFNLWLLVLGGLLVLVVGLVYALLAKPEDDRQVYAAADGEVPLIRAPDAPFKVRPANPGGLDLEGGNQSAFEAAGGLDPGGDLNFDALPEEPIDRSVLAAPRPAPAQPAAAPAEAAEVPAAEPVAAPPKPDVKTAPKNETKEPVANGGGSYALQLGAFSTQAKANEAWKNFTGRYSYLADLEKSVIALDRDGTKLYRLRATGVSSRAQADNLCARLKVAGDQCTVVD
jgi:cell division septation protein DedD